MEVHTVYFGQFISIIGHCMFGLWPLVWDTLQKVLGFCVNIILIKCKCIVLGALRTYCFFLIHMLNCIPKRRN